MKKLHLLIIVLVLTALIVVPSLAAPANGTTLAGYKTIDICKVDDTTWRYSGVITVWNSGAIETEGFKIVDFIEYKIGKNWVKAFDVPVTFSGQIPAGTDLETATAFPYSIDAPPLSGDIRNNVSLTITNHSGNLGKPFGPNPKVTYSGTMPPPECDQDMGCTLTQGYWKNHEEDWIDYSPTDDEFFSSGETWLVVLGTSASESPGYYQLAHQYIAAVLNQAKGAYVPSGIQTTLNLAKAWLEANGPNACTDKSSCGLQKDWAETLDVYNNGKYPGGPAHCE